MAEKFYVGLMLVIVPNVLLDSGLHIVAWYEMVWIGAWLTGSIQCDNIQGDFSSIHYTPI